MVDRIHGEGARVSHTSQKMVNPSQELVRNAPLLNTIAFNELKGNESIDQALRILTKQDIGLKDPYSADSNGHEVKRGSNPAAARKGHQILTVGGFQKMMAAVRGDHVR